MRRILFTILASTALFVAVPAVALAHEGHRAHHHKRHHHSRVRHEKFFGHRHDANDNNGSPATEPTAGTVTSFTDDVLTITLTNGNTISGEVTNDTEVKCENPAEVNDGNGNDLEHGDRISDHGPGGGDDGGNDNQGNDNDNDQMCTITPGMAVRKAELTISGNGAFWDEVELVSSSSSSSSTTSMS